MKEQENTCGKCPHVVKHTIRGMNASIIGCGKTGLVIPHHAKYDEGVAVFWRVPPSCPRSDTKKSVRKAPKRDWVAIPISQIPEAK